MASDKHCQRYLEALDEDDENFFELFEDGVVLAKLLMAVNPSLIRVKDITFKKNQVPLLPIYKNQNLFLCIRALTELGVDMKFLSKDTFMKC